MEYGIDAQQQLRHRLIKFMQNNPSSMRSIALQMNVAGFTLKRFVEGRPIRLRVFLEIKKFLERHKND